MLRNSHHPAPRWKFSTFSFFLLFFALWAAVGCRFARRDAGAEAPPVQPSQRFGVVESYEAPEAATELGVSWTRVRFQWAEVQRAGPDSWEAAVSDEVIDEEIGLGRDIIGLLIGIPDWARDANGLPRGLHLPPDDPDNTWAVFVNDAVSRYDGRINHWVIWNEPDIWDEATPGHTWPGDERDFAQLMRVAYHSAHRANPDVVLHLSAMTYFWDANYGREQYLNRLLTTLADDPEAAQYGYYFDIATAHLYFQPNQLYDILTEWRAIMTSHGLDKPWWLAETNAPVTDDPSWPVESVTLSVLQPEQAAYMPQALAVALAVGIDRIAVYKLIDTPSDRAANPEPFGLLRMDGSKRPAFETYRVAIEQLDGVWGGQRERWNEVGQIRLDGNGRSTTVVFSRLPAAQEAMVLASAETAQLITQTGEASTIKPVNGFFQIPLPPAICSQSIGDYCMIGGQTFYVVQASPRQQPATPTATAIATAIPTESAEAAATQPASTHTPSPTQAPPATATPIPTATQAPSTAPQPASAFNFSYLILLGAGLLAAVGIYLAKKR